MTRLDLRRLRDWEAPTYLIAEAGVNHGGDLGVALEMVRRAAEVGVDAVKFQTYKAERLATAESAAYWDRNAEPASTQFELFKRYDSLEPDDYRTLAAACADAGVDFLSTPFDVDCVVWLAELVPAVKIASADLTNDVLLRAAAATGRPILLSTGAATMDEVVAAVDALGRGGVPDVALLHCTLSYPTATGDAALGAVVALRERFPGLVLGYSDHTRPVDSFDAILAAVSLGARVVEKHYTLDASVPGNDHYHAFEPQQFHELRARLDRLHDLLGASEKRVLEAEEPARLHARRSLVARDAIGRGTLITAELLDVKRPGTGIPPTALADVVGRHAAVDIDADTTLQWEMVDGGPV